MYRNLEKYLEKWSISPNRMPLLVRGARQVGKTYLIENFAKNKFNNCTTINFEQSPEFNECFNTLKPKEIISSIEIILGKEINLKSSLLFLDEIQECPAAITALRYFKEQMPELAIVGAGSLLEFVLNDKNFKMPVGRIQEITLKPLSFLEYLNATGHKKTSDFLESINLSNKIEPVIHNKLLKLSREYMAIGGMPAVINEYLSSNSYIKCQETQKNLLSNYRGDFGKYAKYFQHKHMQLVFDQIPGIITNTFKYSKIDPDIQARDLKLALHKLIDSKLVSKIQATSASGLPFISTVNLKKFKLLFLDIGLVQRACQINISDILNSDIMLLNKGALAEQYVGQELLCLPETEDNLFFWSRESKSSTAEIDYLIALGGKIYPIEVKAGKTGRLKSLKVFMEEKKSKFGIKISENPLSFDNNVLSIPLYLISQLPRLVRMSQDF